MNPAGGSGTICRFVEAIRIDEEQCNVITMKMIMINIAAIGEASSPLFRLINADDCGPLPTLHPPPPLASITSAG